METNLNNVQTGEHVVYNHALTNDKHYFSGFLNLAQDNIDTVFTLFHEKFSPGTQKSDKVISWFSDCFTDKVAPSEYAMKLKFLKQYFPVVECMDLDITDKRFDKKENSQKESERRAYFRNNFKSLLATIGYLRNFYTHHYHTPRDIDKSVFVFLDETLLSVINTVKEKRMKGDKTRMLLKEDLKREVDSLKRDKKKELAKKGFSYGDEVAENAILNDAFQHLLFNDKINKRYSSACNEQNKKTIVRAEGNGINISESGLIFLLSMFLPKKENEQLRSRIQGYKAKVIYNPDNPIDKKNNSLKYMATHWVFNYLSMKPIRHRLNTTFLKETLLMQMVDELSKVPDEIYQTLNKADKDKFVEDINAYYKDLDEVKDQRTEPFVQHTVIRKRYEDRFNYFVLRYLDEFADFPTLRFQIHLGNYVHDSRSKDIGGTNYKTERVIRQKINVFGKLSEITDTKTNFFEKGGDNTTHWEIFPNPSYNLMGNNIPIHFVFNKNVKNNLLEKLKGITSFHKQEVHKAEKKQINKNKPRKKELVENMPDSILCDEPIALLSLNELQSLLYEHLIVGRSGKELEEIIVQKLIDAYNDIKGYTNNSTDSTHNITKNLKNSSDKEELKEDKLIKDVGIEIENTDRKLRMIAQNSSDLKNPNEKRKHIFYNSELGQEATWIAYDIKRFMPESTKNNWKGYQHSQLQQSLAFYDTREGEAFGLLKSCWDFDNDAYRFNDFIKAAFAKNNFVDFYKTYLEGRKDYFQVIQQALENNKGNKKDLKSEINQRQIFDVFYKRNYIIKPTDKQIENLLSQPLVLERGIFDIKPTYIKGKDINDNPDLFADWYRYIQDTEHKFQSFYNLNGDYNDLFEELKESDLYQTNKYSLNKNEQISLLKKKQGRKIKRVKGQDLFLNEMVKAIIRKLNTDSKFSLSLNEYYVSRDDKKTKYKEALAQSKRKKGDHSENIINESSIWSTTIPLRINNSEANAVNIEANAVKIKSSVAKIEGSAANIKESVVKIKECIVNIEENAAKIKAGVVKIEESVAQIKESVTDIKANVAKIEDSAANIKESVAEIKESAVNIEESVVKIEKNAVNIEESAVKIKDIGKFVRFVKDEKAKHIFEYTPNKRWKRIEIEEELNEYESMRREKFFKRIHQLEKSILQSYTLANNSHPEELELKGSPNFKAYIANGLLKKHHLTESGHIHWIMEMDMKVFDKNKPISELKTKPIEIQRAFILAYLRNKIAHNQLPIKEIYDMILKDVKDLTTTSMEKVKISDVIYEYADNVINNFIKMIDTNK